ncbi:hypothetical protein [Mycobacterium barrassiae]|uniref:hypothetical protein n=1 Tax=Mycobacterium barrassiae TaxID=319709 RepID=UPI002265A85B|nr:hypothetical protein [Mycobacterium barrassiae]
MRVLVGGATSVPGIPLLRELTSRGHEVIGVTRSPSKTPQIASATAFGTTWLPLTNAKAKAELGWTPIPR